MKKEKQEITVQPVYISKRLHKKFKDKATKKGQSLKFLVEQFVEKYITEVEE